MKQLSVMIKPASSLCNMRCKYCFYADVSDKRQIQSFGMMSDETMERLLDNVKRQLEPGDSIHFAFQGGEPLLAGIDYFARFTGLTDQWDKSIRVSYALQTNGILLDDAYCELFHRYNFLLGLSLDVLPGYHDSMRVDAAQKGTYKAVVRGMELMRKHGVEFNVLCTLTHAVAAHPQQVWNQLVRLGVDYVQFTPCLGELDGQGKSVYELTPERFASFYQVLFRLWYSDYTRGRYRSVKLFDDIVNRLAFGILTACGMDGQCRPQLVVEADGGVYPCDFYCIDEYRMGSFAEMSLQEISRAPGMAAFLSRSIQRPALCSGCPYDKICGGGCPRMRSNVCCTEGDSSCGYRAFLDACLPQLSEIARSVRMRRRS